MEANSGILIDTSICIILLTWNIIQRNNISSFDVLKIMILLMLRTKWELNYRPLFLVWNIKRRKKDLCDLYQTSLFAFRGVNTTQTEVCPLWQYLFPGNLVLQYLSNQNHEAILLHKNNNTPFMAWSSD